MNARLPKAGYLLAIIGGGWLGIVAFVVGKNIILRETWLGTLARAIDSLPQPVQNPIFFVSWAIFLLGCTGPIYLAIRLLRDSGLRDSKGLPTTNDERPTTVL
jgi:hypothetical protein